MVTDSYWTYHSDQFVFHLNAESQCSTPETKLKCMSTIFQLKIKERYFMGSKLLDNKNSILLITHIC